MNSPVTDVCHSCINKRLLTFLTFKHENAERPVLIEMTKTRWNYFACELTSMQWQLSAPQGEHERVSETGVFPSLDRVFETLCLLHYVTEASHLHSLRDF